jgi:hypothetical protein
MRESGFKIYLKIAQARMKKTKFMEERIVFSLTEHQQDTKVEDIFRKLGIA